MEKAKAEISEEPSEVGTLDRTESANETLANSLLTRIDPKNATADEIKEAFCRDIDSFSFEMQVLNCNEGNTNIKIHSTHHSPVKLSH